MVSPMDDLPPAFSQTRAYAALDALAKRPLDMRSLLTPQRIAAYQVKGAGYTLSYATELVDDKVLQKLKELAHECDALGWMEQMQAGAVVNAIEGYASERRPALHTALRDIFDHPQQAQAAQDAAALAKREIKKIETLIPKLQEAFDTLIVIGIGGSELGPQALYLALDAYKQSVRKVLFVGNIDPDDLVKALREQPLDRTAVVVVSKSGTTQETVVNETFARHLFEEKGLDSNRHFFAITGEGSPMDDPKRYHTCFYIWDWVGGRYSGSSAIGGLILAFSCGFQIYYELLRGAHAMDQVALHRLPEDNLPLFAALLEIWNHNFLRIPTVAVIPYSKALWRFPAHLQQLDMESNGKSCDRLGRAVDFSTGPIVWGESGTNAQHSFYQLIHQGTSLVHMILIGFFKSQLEKDVKVEGTSSQQKLWANLIAQAVALAVGKGSDNPNRRFEGNRPSQILWAEKLTPYALGALLAFFEHKTAFQGFIWGINSFDQEGVQLGKILAQRVLDRMAQQGEKELILDSYLSMLHGHAHR